MSRRVIALAALAAALVAAPAALHAQSPVRFGLAAGATFPTGDALKDSHEWGYNASASITARPMLSPIGIRGEVMFHQLTGKDVDGFDFDNANIFAGLVNAEIGMGGIGVKPYVIGGIGFYRVDLGGGDGGVVTLETDAENAFGFNAGAGLDFGLAGFSAFAEARFHSIRKDGDALNIVPVSFGIRF